MQKSGWWRVSTSCGAVLCHSWEITLNRAGAERTATSKAPTSPDLWGWSADMMMRVLSFDGSTGMERSCPRSRWLPRIWWVEAYWWGSILWLEISEEGEAEFNIFLYFKSWLYLSQVRRSLRTLREKNDVRGVLGVLETCIRTNFAGVESAR